MNRTPPGSCSEVRPCFVTPSAERIAAALPPSVPPAAAVWCLQPQYEQVGSLGRLRLVDSVYVSCATADEVLVHGRAYAVRGDALPEDPVGRHPHDHRVALPVAHSAAPGGVRQPQNALLDTLQGAAAAMHLEFPAATYVCFKQRARDPPRSPPHLKSHCRNGRHAGTDAAGTDHTASIALTNPQWRPPCRTGARARRRQWWWLHLC